MKIKRLYIKIFLSFIFIFLVSEIIIFGIFHLLTERTATNELQKYLTNTIYLFKGIVEEKINTEPDKSIYENTELKKFITDISNNYDLKVWFETPAGNISFFDGEIPKIMNENLKKTDTYFYKIEFGKNRLLFVKIPIQLKNQIKTYICVFHKIKPYPFRMPFIYGLAVVGFIIALLVYPFSRYITKPLKKLKDSVNNIAGGDLSNRVKIKSNDEIGELANSFNRMAETIENMITGTKELTANISHELRSPLTRIRIAEEMLANKLKEKNPDVEHYLKSIENEIMEMDNLLYQALQFAKLDINKPVMREEIDLVNIIIEIIEKYKTAFEKKSISIVLNDSGEKCLITGQKEEIKTVFSNIIDNAVKYTREKGNVNISINKGIGDIVIAIFNSCGPLSDYELLNIFRPFYRIASDFECSGTGLGLAITEKVIKNHGGKINAKNVTGGLEFRIIMPEG